MESDDDVLARLASGGSMEYSTWPILLSTIVSRIEKIAVTEFPTPVLPPPPKPRSPLPEPQLLAPLPSSDPIEPPSDRTAIEDDSSQETNKENTNPAPPPPRLPTPPTQSTEPGTLPGPVVWLMNDITTTLTLSFPKFPPHTIQRLAELVVNPTQHYRSLPSYLHALDRVVHVTSGNNIYPLPPAVADMSSMTPHVRLTNGAPDSPGGTVQPNGPTNASAALNVGSDEALGGALLTPIPWLQRTRMDTSSRDSESEDGATSPIDTESSTSQPILTPTSDETAATASGEQPQPQTGSTSPTDAASAQQLRHQRRMEGQVRTESTETIEGPNGGGIIETVSVSVNGVPSHGAATTSTAALAASLSRGVTQGELLRQEQRAGVVPLSQLSSSRQAAALAAAQPSSASPPPLERVDGDVEIPSPEPAAPAEAPKTPPPTATDEDGDAAMGSDSGEPDEEALSSPHARGPDEIGPADTGPQNAAGAAAIGSGGMDVKIDIEAAVGRKAEPIEAAKADDGGEKSGERGGGVSENEEKAEEKEAGEAMDIEKRESTPKRELEAGAESEIPAKKIKGEEAGEDARTEA